MTLLQEQRVTLTRVLVAISEEAKTHGYYLALDFCRRCTDCKIGHPQSAHKEARAMDVVLYHQATGEVCREDTVFSALHDVADLHGAARRIPGDLGHFSVAAEGQVR